MKNTSISLLIVSFLTFSVACTPTVTSSSPLPESIIDAGPPAPTWASEKDRCLGVEDALCCAGASDAANQQCIAHHAGHGGCGQRQDHPDYMACVTLFEADVEIAAQRPCAEALEAQYPYKIEWTDGFLGEKFDKYRPGVVSLKDSTIQFSGSSANFQNRYGALEQNVHYECQYNAATKTAKAWDYSETTKDQAREEFLRSFRRGR